MSGMIRRYGTMNILKAPVRHLSTFFEKKPDTKQNPSITADMHTT